MITGEVVNAKKVPDNMRRAVGAIDTALERTILKLAIKMTGLVKQKLSGDVLNVRSGRLRRSIHFEMFRAGSKVEASVGTNVVYAKTHELGLTIPAHIVEARRAKALRWEKGGNVFFAKRVNIPAVAMKKRSFLQASLEQMAPEIRATLAAEVGGEAKRVIMEGAR